VTDNPDAVTGNPDAVTDNPDAVRYRWLVLAVFVLSTAINYLDRQMLSALAPVLKAEFHISNTQFGLMLAAFGLTNALSAPFAGMLIDRIGLNRAISLAVGLWSCAGIATGATRGLAALMGCRAVLGVAEGAGIPSAGKAIRQYLKPAERALGNAMNQGGVSLGLALAPIVGTTIAARAGWRHAFVLTGVLGLIWIPLWNWAAAHAEAAAQPGAEPGAGGELLRDRRLWAFFAANALSMVLYSLWFNWTTLFLSEVHHLTLIQTAWYAWIPPVGATVGGVAGGWLSLRLVRRGVPAMSARFRVCVAASAIALVTVAVPAATSPGWAAAGISLSFLSVAAFSVNMYTLPLDAFPSARAAFAVSMLVAGTGVTTVVISPLIGWVVDHYGYTPVTTFAAPMPLIACAVLWSTRSVR
jgi:ACS family hexuronate transporter-like MFS transporter